ncbi:phage protein GemA/Gp16 family protein [Photobacterium damselae]|uniref:phage protein GemA/Gp16 family protein n=1 Tax=Photobacterium damselae TaxID=38293 RepID=UPI004068AEB8
MNRYQMYGLIHKGMKTKLTIELGEFTDEMYRDCLKNLTGKSSCKEMTFAQLNQVLDCLIQGGYIRFNKAQADAQRPTDAQWRKLAALSYSKGWSGLNDAALKSFVNRTVQTSNVKSLTRAQITDVITGLEKWREGNDTR